MKILAPAKINLSLHITGRRADGYHTLDSLVAFADIGDEITIEPAETFSFTVNGTFAAGLENEDNLAVCAARLMSAHCGRDLNIALSLTKNLPVAAGVGGGSADAAAVMRGLLAYWQVQADLRPLALSLGADVPACLQGTPQHMRGIGEVLTPVRIAPFHIVLVNPLKPCPTKDVFAQFQSPLKKEIQYSEKIDLSDLQACGNDLTDAACAIVPEITDILIALKKQNNCLLARLSGSGATCFGLFENAADAHKAAARLQEQLPGWWVREGKLLR